MFDERITTDAADELRARRARIMVKALREIDARGGISVGTEVALRRADAELAAEKVSAGLD